MIEHRTGKKMLVSVVCVGNSFSIKVYMYIFVTIAELVGIFYKTSCICVGKF